MKRFVFLNILNPKLNKTFEFLEILKALDQHRGAAKIQISKKNVKNSNKSTTFLNSRVYAGPTSHQIIKEPRSQFRAPGVDFNVNYDVFITPCFVLRLEFSGPDAYFYAKSQYFRDFSHIENRSQKHRKRIKIHAQMGGV